MKDPNHYKFIRLCQGVWDKGQLYLREEVLDHITDPDKDWYESVYFYNEDHYNQFKKTNSIKGMKDVLTNKLIFDFDNEEDNDAAREEARKLIYRLTEIGIKEKDIKIFFSGNKGFNVSIDLNVYLSPFQIAKVVDKITKGLEMDRSLYDHSQLIRIPGTRHQVSKLYKIPLTFKQFFNTPLEDIRSLATSMDNIKEDDFNWSTVDLPEDYLNFEEKPFQKIEVKPVIQPELDLSQKPKHWRNCKWSLLQGNFKSGERHNALLILAATCRGLGYDKETTYYLCKSSLKKQAAGSASEEFSKEELWNNIIEQSVFKDGWEGGQYSCKNDPWLHNYCENLGDLKCQDRNENESAVITLNDMSSNFINYATNFEKNIIKTGLGELDGNVMLLASTLNGLLGQPGAGKTSKALNYLKHTSLSDIPSMFFSLDMGEPIVFGKVIQKLTGYSFNQVVDIYKNNPSERDRLNEMFYAEYKNVGFNFKSGLTVADMKRQILDRQESIGKPIKLVVVDYLECLAGPYSDSTANTGFIANQLKDLANELNTCILLLLQTQKHSTSDIADPLLSLKGVKGSSVIEQSCSVILTLWREGYNPETVEDDRYMSFAVVKNRFGSLWRGDFAWDGVRGNIASLTQEQRERLREFKARKEAMKIEKALKDKGEWS